MSGLITVLVDGSPVAIDTLWWPAMNFGQFRWPGTVVEYELAVPRAAFVALLEPAYLQCAAELRADDALVPDQSPCPLRAAGYPPLADLLGRPAALAEAVGVYLWEDLFRAVLPHLPTPAAAFVLNSVGRVAASPTAIVVGGRGYGFETYRRRLQAKGDSELRLAA